jgi:hypothetical protein
VIHVFTEKKHSIFQFTFWVHSKRKSGLGSFAKIFSAQGLMDDKPSNKTSTTSGRENSGAGFSPLLNMDRTFVPVRDK